MSSISGAILSRFLGPMLAVTRVLDGFAGGATATASTTSPTLAHLVGQNSAIPGRRSPTR